LDTPQIMFRERAHGPKLKGAQDKELGRRSPQLKFKP
jgi:hypothetical protein